MYRIIALLGLLAVPAFASGQAPTLADAKAKNATKLSATELQALMPGAKVVNYGDAGGRRTWDNKADGTLAASSDGRGSSSGRPRPGSGNGTWRISDTGEYCVKLQWGGMKSEDWCRFILKAGDKYYGFEKLEDTAQGSEFEFSK